MAPQAKLETIATIKYSQGTDKASGGGSNTPARIATIAAAIVNPVISPRVVPPATTSSPSTHKNPPSCERVAPSAVRSVKLRLRSASPGDVDRLDEWFRHRQYVRLRGE